LVFSCELLREKQIGEGAGGEHLTSAAQPTGGGWKIGDLVTQPTLDNATSAPWGIVQNRIKMKIVQIPFLALIVTLPPYDIAQAQTSNRPAAAKETVVLQRVAVPGTDREMGMGIADFPPNSSKPRQKAIGPETCFVLKGEVTVQVEGQQKKVFHEGESFQFPAMVVHQTTAGPEGARILATWVDTPGDQFNIPAPR